MMAPRLERKSLRGALFRKVPSSWRGTYLKVTGYRSHVCSYHSLYSKFTTYVRTLQFSLETATTKCVFFQPNIEFSTMYMKQFNLLSAKKWTM